MKIIWKIVLEKNLKRRRPLSKKKRNETMICIKNKNDTFGHLKYHKKIVKCVFLNIYIYILAR